MNYIFGYINFIDGSARGLPPPGNIVLPDEVARHVRADRPVHRHRRRDHATRTSCRSSCGSTATLKQNFNTDDMAHKIPRCIEWVSSIHTLEPGDILATGTNHRGLNAFQDGDVVELETEGLGRLRFNVRDELKRTWGRETRLDVARTRLEGPHDAAAHRQVRQGHSLIAIATNRGRDATRARRPPRRVLARLLAG